MSASRYLSKQVRYDNRIEGICFKIKISQVWLTPSSSSNEEYSWLASLIKAMDHISKRAHTHVHFKSCSFLSQCASVQWITMFPIIFSQKNKHTHTHQCCYLSSPPLPLLHQKAVDTDAAPTHCACVYRCVCVLFRRSYVIKWDCSNERSFVLLHFQCFLVKWNGFVPADNRLLIQIHHFSEAFSALLSCFFTKRLSALKTEDPLKHIF